MKKVLSVILSISILLSCFMLSTSAVCYHEYSTRYKHIAYSTYHIRIECRVCSTCGDTIEVKRKQQSHFDATGDKKCDQCGSYMSSSTPSTPSNPSNPSCEHSDCDLTPSYSYIDIDRHSVWIYEYCFDCFSFIDEESYEKHVDKNHDGICEKCEAKYTSESSHRGSEVAYYEYSDIDDSERHQVAKYCTCSWCEEPYFVNSYKEYHKDNDKDSKCDLCKKEINHQKHYDENKDVECDFCGYILRTYTLSKFYDVRYNEKASFKVVSDNLPEGVGLAIYSYDDQENPLVTSFEGTVEWTTGSMKDKEIYVIKFVDSNGTPILNSSKVECCEIYIYVDGSLFDRIISFFRSLFGMQMVNMVGTYQFNY